MIALRPCETDADYEVWLAVRPAVLPRERTAGLEEFKPTIKPGDGHLLADLDGELAGSGLMNRSDTGGAHVAPRVLPDKRGRGVGTALLERLAEYAVERGYTRAGSHVAGDDARSIAFARRLGFEEARRDVKQVLEIGGTAPAPRHVDGVEFVSIDARPGSEIVGYAGLMHWPDDPSKAEHGLTVVRRNRRRRGIAAALKEREIAWAAANGVRELITWTQTGNENMQAVNTGLGYVTSEIDISFTRGLPL